MALRNCERLEQRLAVLTEPAEVAFLARVVEVPQVGAATYGSNHKGTKTQRNTNRGRIKLSGLRPLLVCLCVFVPLWLLPYVTVGSSFIINRNHRPVDQIPHGTRHVLFALTLLPAPVAPF